MYKKSVFVLVLNTSISTSALALQQVSVPDGAFKMGCSATDSKCEKDEGQAGGISVNVPAFKIDKYEVTVANYKKCMAAGKCKKPKDHQRNKYCNLGAKGRENHPINCIDWQDAQTYCQWRGARLPYEAEWEKAARAGSTTAYPWGNTVSCKQAILDDGVTQGSVKGEPDGCGEDRTWSVGSRPPNALGLYDMHGNAGEWVSNWYGKNALAENYAKGDLKGPASGKQKVVRGGSWDENIANLRSSFRNVKPPVSGDTIYGSIGFRCVSEK